jgi:hypothetical protein
MEDANATHIPQKFVSTIQYPYNQYVYNLINENIVSLTTQKNACCALQKCIECANPEQRKEIIDRIISNGNILISDPYGNYVIQYIISLNNHDTNHRISLIFKNNINYLSKQKFSSNVIEKCFDFCDDNTKLNIVKEIANPKIVADLLLDMYGNYGTISYIIL